MLTEIPIHPLIAFGHLSLYLQKHLGQSLAVCGKVDHGSLFRSVSPVPLSSGHPCCPVRYAKFNNRYVKQGCYLHQCDHVTRHPSQPWQPCHPCCPSLLSPLSQISSQPSLVGPYTYVSIVLNCASFSLWSWLGL